MSFHFRSFEQMLVTLAESVRPPERLTVSEAAEKYRRLREATHVGPWDNSIAPYLVEVMDEMESLEFSADVFVGPARCGKTDIFHNWLGYSANCDPGDMMVVHMTQSTARDWSQGDLRKMLRHSTAIGRRVLPGKQNMNTHDLRFDSGMRLLVKWPTITELSGKTIRRMWLMDHDRMPLDIDGEGAPFDLARKRTQTFGRHGMTVAESSPGFEVTNHRWIARTPHEAPPTEGILSIYNRGDRRRWYWRCANPECCKAFEGDFQHFKWDDHDPETGEVYDKVQMAESVRLVCPRCEFKHTHDPGPGQPGKVGLNRRGRWIKDGQKWEDDGTISGRPYRSDIASFWLKGVAAAFVTWRELVLKWLNAMEDYERTGDAGSLKTTVNTDQGLPFTPPALAADRLPETLKARARADLGERVVPEGTRFLTAAIDVQGGSHQGRFEVQVHGHGVGGDLGIIDRFAIRKSQRLDDDGDPLPLNPRSYLEDWQLLVEQVIEKSYPLADGSGRQMSIKAVVCDSGGQEGVTVNAYNFWRWLRDEHPAGHHKRFQLLKGNPQRGAPRAVISYPDSERKDRRAGARGEVPIMLLNVNMLKDQLDGRLDRLDEHGGMISFPAWLPDSFYSELTVEVRVPNKGWENPKKLRNEAWDLLTYTLGLMVIQRHGAMDLIDWDKPPAWALDWDENPLVFEPERDRPFESKPKVRFDLAELAEALA